MYDEPHAAAALERAEHALLPTVIHWVASGRLSLAPPTFHDAPSPDGGFVSPRFDGPA